jgi:uncharacterized membrane protein (DUF441 family)
MPKYVNNSFIILILSIIITITTFTVNAKPLTKGNIFAEGFAGCSIGIVFNILTTQTPLLNTTHRIDLLQSCVTGSILAATIYGFIELYNVGTEILHIHRFANEENPMVYPETPGWKY